MVRYTRTRCSTTAQGSGDLTAHGCSDCCCWLLPPSLHFGLLGVPYRLLSALFAHLTQLSALSFGAVAIVWYALYRCGSSAHVYVEVVSVVFVLGWMFTLQFTKGLFRFFVASKRCKS